MKSCLIVDDSKVVRRVAREILEDLSFNCIDAEDGQVAIDICKETLPDAVLLDWNMPNKDGLEFLKELRALPNGQSPIVVFCTTENEMAAITQALAAGANEYIMKPFDSDVIVSKFKQTGLL